MDYERIKEIWQIKPWQLSTDFNTEILEVLPHIESLLKLNGQYIQIYDTTSIDFAYISESTETVLGYPLDIWKSKKYTFILDIFCPDDVQVSEKIHNHLLVHGMQQPRKIRPNFRYTNTFRMRHKNGRYIWLLNHLIFLASTDDGKPYMMMSYTTDISHIKNNDDIPYIISKYNPSEKRYETLETQIYMTNGSELLSENEKKVLCFLSDGFSNEEIAARMGLSVHTIRDHRRNMLRKTDIDNTCQLLSFALKNSVI
jgi:DNA-binding CsgD family transcriptional regulator